MTFYICLYFRAKAPKKMVETKGEEYDTKVHPGKVYQKWSSVDF